MLLPFLSVAQLSVLDFKPVDVGKAQLTAADQSRYQTLKRSDTYKSLSVVNIGKLSDLKSDTIVMAMPDQKEPFKVVPEYVQEEADGSLMWGGRLIGRSGYLLIVETKEGVSGFLQTGPKFYDLLPAGRSAQLWGERDNTKNRALKDVNHSTQTTTTSSGPERCAYPSGSNTYNICPAVVSILIVLTPDAKTWILNNYGSSIQNYMSALRGSIIFALHNSDVPNKSVRLTWIEKTVPLTGDIDTDRDDLPTLIGPDRATAQADVAFVLTNISAYGVGGFVTDFGLNSANAYGVVQAPFGISQFVLAHEFGHLMNCRHNWPVDFGNDSTPTCAHGFRWYYRTDGMPLSTTETNYVNSESTIVSVPLPTGGLYLWKDDLGTEYDLFLQADARVLHYSNPTVVYNGFYTGRPKNYVADNAYYLRNNMCTAEGFYNTPELQISVNVPPCNQWPMIFTPNVSTPPTGYPGQPPYTYAWHWSFTGIFPFSEYFSNALAFTQTLTLNNAPYCPVFWLRLTVASSDGVLVSKIIKVDLSDELNCVCTPPGGLQQEGSEERSVSGLLRGVYPNPAESGQPYRIVAPDLAGQTLPYRLCDALGRTSHSGQIAFDAQGIGTCTTLNSRASGLHFLHLQTTDKQPAIFKLIIQ